MDNNFLSIQPIYVYVIGEFNLFTFKLLIGKYLLLPFCYWCSVYFVGFLTLVSSRLLPSFVFHWFFCSDMLWFPSNFLLCIFYRYFLCGYHFDYIKYLKVITVFLKIYLFYFWLRCVFVAARGLSLVVVRGATLRCSVQASHCGGFSCCGAQALGAQASVVVARGSRVQAK